VDPKLSRREAGNHQNTVWSDLYEKMSDSHGQ
jgi:hypothetical protein